MTAATTTNMDQYRDLTRQILRVYRAVPPDVAQAGREWYDVAFSHCERISAYSGRYSMEQVAIAMAHLSPRTSWRANLEATERLCLGGEKPPQILNRSWDKAGASLVVPSSLRWNTFTSAARKTRSFAEAILGNHNAVVVDIWCARVCGAEEHIIKTRLGYVTVAEAFRRAARRVEDSPRDVQAITWTYLRGRAT